MLRRVARGGAFDEWVGFLGRLVDFWVWVARVEVWFVRSCRVAVGERLIVWCWAGPISLEILAGCFPSCVLVSYGVSGGEESWSGDSVGERYVFGAIVAISSSGE